MRKLIMWNIVTLDGYFEGNQNWDLPFHEIVWGEELEKLSIEQLNSADYLVFGRVTYEGMAAHWPKLLSLRKMLLPKSKNLKHKAVGICMCSAVQTFPRLFINDNLFDEYRIGIAPVILGSGRLLFREKLSSEKLSLDSAQRLSSGGVVLSSHGLLVRFSDPGWFSN